LGGSKVHGQATISYYDGITHTGSLSLLLTQNGGVNPTFYQNLGSTLTPSQLQATGLAATTLIVVSGWFWI